MIHSKKSNKILNLLGILFIFLFLSNNFASACTGFTYSEGDEVFVGSNEDWYDYDFWIRFLVTEGDTYGRLIFENHWPIPPDPNWRCPQAGMNDKGLFYDCFATPYLRPVNSSDKPYYYNSSDHYRYSLESYVLSVCSTIDEVLDLYDDYNLEHMERYQVLWVDKNGDSIIIEGDDIVFKQGDYQVVTNFIQTHPWLGGHPCWRYDTADSMLENMNELTVEYFTSICNATHQTGFYPSVYSGIYDLNQEILYLYYFYNYDDSVIIDLEEELLLGEHVYFLADLFEGFNNPPNKPIINGPKSGKPNIEYEFTFNSTDPNDDAVMYIIKWGDGNSEWTEYGDSGEEITLKHTWNSKGKFTIKAKAIDINESESEWSEFIVTMPRNKNINSNFNLLGFLFDRFPNVFPILRYLLRL